MLTEKYIWHGMDITLDVYEKLCSVVELIAENEGTGFDECFSGFVKTSLYRVLQKLDCTMWAESAPYIFDEYYRRKAMGSL